MGLAKICFWIAILALVHTYLLYPLILWLLSRNRKANQLVYEEQDDWPVVHVFMAVHNEEVVIKQKMESLLALNYPKHKIKLFIGSDCSSDQSDAIIQTFAHPADNINFFPFTTRQGKPRLVNALVEKSRTQSPGDQIIYLMTDASVILDTQCLRQLVKHFKQPEIFLVDAHMKSTGLDQGGISKSEGTYIRSEVRLKEMESRCWGKMIGPFGGCYAIRGNYYHPVPDNYLVDDFYITMKGYERGGMAINELDAICYEKVGMAQEEEYRRKARISAGNFQNMFTFFKLWFPPFNRLAFAFFSHKILRWLGPFFIIFALGSLLWINWFSETLHYRILLMGMLAWLILVPILDRLLSAIGMKNSLFKNIAYFNSMNQALFSGFIKYINGINTNVWQPPRRE